MGWEGAAGHSLRMPVHPVVVRAVGDDVPGGIEVASVGAATSGSGASAGGGSPNHMAGELFKSMTGANMVHVPYRGAGPALTDMLGEQVEVMFTTTAAAIDHIKAGKLRALAFPTHFFFV